MNGPITRLDKPAEQLPQVARPAIVDKALARATGGNNDSAKAAAESNLVAFSLTGSANGAPVPTSQAGQPQIRMACRRRISQSALEILAQANTDNRHSGV